MKIGYYLMKGLLTPLSALPLKFHYAWAGFFSWLMKDVMHYRKNVVMINLARSFPEKKYAEIVKISDRFYRHFGELVAETIWFGGCHDYKRLHKQHLVECINPEVLNDAFKSAPSVMVMNSHCGNWELTGGFFGYNYTDTPLAGKESDICVVYKELKNKTWDKIIAENRCAPIPKWFQGYIESYKVLYYALEHKNDRKFYIFPTDQYPYGKAKGHEIGSFLNQPTKTMTGGAALARKLKMCVLYVRFVSVSRGHYELSFVPICSDASQFTPEELMEKYYALLEEDIKAQPWNYLWSHKRWK